jgi:hypothetical protein
MEIDYSILAAILTSAIAFVMASLGAKYHRDYSAAIASLNTVTGLASEITASLDVIVEALQDDTVDGQELEVIVDHLKSLKVKLDGIKNA